MKLQFHRGSQTRHLLLLLLLLECLLSLRRISHLPVFVDALTVNSVYPPLWNSLSDLLISTQDKRSTDLVQEHDKDNVVPGVNCCCQRITFLLSRVISSPGKDTLPEASQAMQERHLDTEPVESSHETVGHPGLMQTKNEALLRKQIVDDRRE